MPANSLEKIVSWAKRRGFVFPGSEIYGGLANTYDYGPMGVEVLWNIRDIWWRRFVRSREDVLGLHSAVLMNPEVWRASGHTRSFTDVLIDCKDCQARIRADHLIENYFADQGEEVKVEGLTPEELENLIEKEEMECPRCGAFAWTEPRRFNLLFETNIGILKKDRSLAYLRGEIAQGMFVNFKPVVDSVHPDLPFGLAQSGTAFRNEITLGNFVFRTLQFNLAELEYFFNRDQSHWEEIFEYWRDEAEKFATQVLGLEKKNLRWRPHTDEERAHYSKRTEDLDYRFPFGYKELFAVAYRTDFDLRNHMRESGVDLRVRDRKTGERFIPHVVEPTFGLDRAFLAAVCEAYREEKERVVLSFPPPIAPYKVAVFPLLANKPELVKKARGIFDCLKKEFSAAWDDRGNIGKRYYSQDELGTPFCVTVDFDTLKDDTVTIRERDSKEQVRLGTEDLEKTIQKLVNDKVEFKEVGQHFK